MKIIMNCSRYLFCIIILVFSKCSSPRENIDNKWIIYQIENMKSNEFISIPIRESSPYIEFNLDGSFEGHNDFGLQQGTWLFENVNHEMKIVLNQKNDTVIMRIDELDKNNLVWRIQENDLMLRFHSKPN